MIYGYDIEPASVGSVENGAKKFKISIFPTNQKLRLSLRLPKSLKKAEKSSENKFVEMWTKMSLYLWKVSKTSFLTWKNI